MRFEPNTIDGLHWGLKNFDGVEFDIRLTKDNGLVIHHDPFLTSGEYIATLSLKELEARGIPTLREFLDHQDTRSFAAQGKVFLIELKPNCNGKMLVEKPLAKTFYQKFTSLVNELNFPTKSIRFISFSETLLFPFRQSFPSYPIIPALNECQTVTISKPMYLKLLWTFISKRIKPAILHAHKMGYAGVLFARQFILGPLHLVQGKYDSILKLANEYNLELGTNLGQVELEKQYPELLRISDKLSIYPRYASEGEAPIIAHRGTGTKGVEVPNN